MTSLDLNETITNFDAMPDEEFKQIAVWLTELAHRRAADERREADKEAYFARLGRAAEKYLQACPLKGAYSIDSDMCQESCTDIYLCKRLHEADNGRERSGASGR